MSGDLATDASTVALPSVGRIALSMCAAAAAAAVAVVPLVIWCGAGVASAASAPDVSGQKYSEASSALQKAGFTAEVGSVVGDRLAQSDCIVTGQALDSLPSIGTKKYQNGAKNVRLVLNCDAVKATATAPGMSAANPEGKRIQDLIDNAKK